MLKNNESVGKKNPILAFFAAIHNGICSGMEKLGCLLADTKKSLIVAVAVSFLFNFLLELSLRQNILLVFKLMFTSPEVFFIGFIIIFASLSVMYLFRRRSFAFLMLSLIWIIIMCVNFYMMCICQRSTPFSSADLRVFNTALEIISNGYLSVSDMILLSILIAFVIYLLVISFIKSKKAKGLLGLASFISVQAWAVMLVVVVYFTNIVVLADKYDNPPAMFRKHGYAYCFLYSVIDIGIDKPYGYSPDYFNEHRNNVNARFDAEKKNVEEVFVVEDEHKDLTTTIYEMVIDDYKAMPHYPYIGVTEEEAAVAISRLESKFEDYQQNLADKTDDQNKTDCNLTKPNIIFLQLESFYDVTNIEGYEYSQSPHPIYSMLKENLNTGFLTVPSIGAGTANTEFEIMTGMNKAHFGFGEYPYLSVMQKRTCESMAYNSRDYGYKSHVIHNHKGTFYDRNIVFPNLGFDTFTSIENMVDVVTNPRNWAKDKVLLEPILDCLDSTEEQDLIYTISVQPHGKYPSEEIYKKILRGSEPKVELYGNEDNPENPGFAYYVNQLSEVDTFIGELILELTFRDEPTILVFYGDHLPSFSVQKYWSLKSGNYFQTDYIVWNNCGIDFSDAKDLSTFQLCSYIFSKVGIDSGDINKLNRIHLGGSVEDYHELLKMYQYAVFYDKNIQGPESKVKIQTYEPTQIVYGIATGRIDKIYKIGDVTFIIGDNFNKNSKIIIDGDKVDTAFINRNLIMTNSDVDIGSVITTRQSASGNIYLGNGMNEVIFDNNAIVSEDNYDDVLSDIFDSIGPIQHEDAVIDDATADFVTGQDEIDMIQMPEENTAE